MVFQLFLVLFIMYEHAVDGGLSRRKIHHAAFYLCDHYAEAAKDGGCAYPAWTVTRTSANDGVHKGIVQNLSK